MANIFNKILDFIGLVDDPAPSRDDDFPSAQHTRGGSVPTRKKTSITNDEFSKEPRMSRVSPASNRNSSLGASASPLGGRTTNDEFDAEEAWEPHQTTEYGKRNQQNVQGNNRPTAQYAGGYRINPQSIPNTRPASSGRYESNRPYDDYAQPLRERDGFSGRNSGYDTRSYNNPNTSSAASGYYGGEQMGASRHVTHRFSSLTIRSVDECKMVIRTLLENRSVLLNLEEMDSVQAQRAVDTMSGATYAIGAKMSRAAERAWLLTPVTVEVDDGVEPQDGGTFQR